MDTDGQFLLIEAANALPRWLNPEVADLRVWINSGKLFIIPLGTAEKAKPDTLTLEQAIDILRNKRSELLHSPPIEAEAFYHLQKYPKQISDSLHHALIKIPRKLAYTLHHGAAYISPAAEAFYLRDPVALRPLQCSSTRELFFPPSDCVTMSAKFTKVGYAQLKSQQFDPPPSWTDFWSSYNGSKSFEKVNMGMKVACGFEMLMSDPQNQDRKAVREIKILLEDLKTGEDQLPSDAEMRTWQIREDDESWLDINFEIFEKELRGNGKRDSNGINQGFGDKGTQDHLRKMVARFQEFMNDDAETEGAQYVDDMDIDNDDDSASSDHIGGDVQDIDFDENAFAKMLKEMMGMPTEAVIAEHTQYGATSGITQDEGVASVSTDEGDEEGLGQDILDIERELRQAGTLNLDHAQPLKMPQLQYESTKDQPDALAAADQDAEDETVDIDFNLAKNLLESFKSQGGTPGPSGNLLGLMGIHMPRDEHS